MLHDPRPTALTAREHRHRAVAWIREHEDGPIEPGAFLVRTHRGPVWTALVTPRTTMVCIEDPLFRRDPRAISKRSATVVPRRAARSSGYGVDAKLRNRRV